jgi:hypothetical protein
LPASFGDFSLRSLTGFHPRRRIRNRHQPEGFRIALKPRTIRLSDQVWENSKLLAEKEGISANQWISECVVARVTWEFARSSEPVIADYERIYEVVKELRENP